MNGTRAYLFLQKTPISSIGEGNLNHMRLV